MVSLISHDSRVRENSEVVMNFTQIYRVVIYLYIDDSYLQYLVGYLVIYK